MAMTISGSGTITGLSAGGLPDATITQADLATGVAGTGPAFAAYMTNGSANQSVTSGVFTKVKIDTKVFDTNTNFDATTNYRFTPTVAGYYQINSSIGLSATVPSLYIVGIYKNGVIFGAGSQLQGLAGTASQILQCSGLVYLNGSTDYVELYGLIVGTSPVFVFSSNNTTFQASMVRAA